MTPTTSSIGSLATVQLVAVAVIAASLSAPAMSTVAFRCRVHHRSGLTLLVMYWRARFHVPRPGIWSAVISSGFGLGALIWTASVFAQSSPISFSGRWRMFGRPGDAVGDASASGPSAAGRVSSSGAVRACSPSSFSASP